MQIRFRHILLLITLLAGAHRALAQSGAPDEVCVGTSRMYGVKGNPGSVYSWKIDGVTQLSTADSMKVQWNTVGDHIVEVQEFRKGCWGDVQMELVKVTGQLTAAVSIAENMNNICPGAMVTFTATPVNGGTIPRYQWKVNGVNAGANSPAYSFAPADGDKVSVEMISNDACVSVSQVVSNRVIIQVSPLVLTNPKIAIDPVTRKGSIDITVSGGSGPGNYLFNWNNGQTTEDIANLTEGTYDVTITDQLTNCILQDTFVIELDKWEIICSTIQPNCDIQSGTITVTNPVPSDGLVYVLRGIVPAVNPISNATGIFENLTPGASYGILVRDTITGIISSEIIKQLDVVPASPATPVLQVSVTPSCNNPDGTVMVVRPRGTDYQYSMDGGPYQGSAIFAGLRWGDHTVRVRNIKTGCVSEEGKIEVPAIPPPPVITAWEDRAICYGGTGFIEFSITNVKAGIHVIKHDQGQFQVAIKADGTGKVVAPVGKYNNLTMEVGGCSSYNPDRIVNVEVTQPDDIVISAAITPINLITKENASISLSVTGGSGNYTFNWNNGETTKNITNLNPGNYIVRVFDENNCYKDDTIRILLPTVPHAYDDSFYSLCNIISGNVLLNDNDPEFDRLFINETPVLYPKHGTVNLSSDGTFEYHADLLFTGIDSFKYELFDKNRFPGIYGAVVLEILPDKDRDGVTDSKDKDMDGDGILNELDGPADADGDGLPNSLDIDADGDGIPDQIEAQASANYIRPAFLDVNSNGVDDAYDNFQMTKEIIPVDTDHDGVPDFLDPDSDNDLVPDRIEGCDQNADGLPDHVSLEKDTDADGLEDGYDNYLMECDPMDNVIRSNAALQDFDGDGLPDWRDENDDNDDFLTKYEDMDGNGNLGNDDFDYDGHPEYLDYGRECDLFIPDAFSPNGDGVHDYYQIYCINHYPNAKIYIFDQLGNKLFEKSNYGNLEVWQTPEAAWWDGIPDRGRGRGERVAPGTYYYVLDLGNGEVKKSFVFVSY